MHTVRHLFPSCSFDSLQKLVQIGLSASQFHKSPRMEHEVNDVDIWCREAPSHPLPRLVQQLHLVPRTAVLPSHYRGADTDSITQSLGEEIREHKQGEREKDF